MCFGPTEDGMSGYEYEEITQKKFKKVCSNQKK